MCFKILRRFTNAIPSEFFVWSSVLLQLHVKKGKGSPYSITERRVQELIPVPGSQPAGDVSHKPGGYAAITFRQACSYPRNP